jgi:hypothetical protein
MNVQVFIARTAAALAICAFAGVAGAQTPTASAVVGEATLVIGVAKVFAADGSSRAVERGTAIRVGDRVETEAGGHVHFRFVDGGRLSIRPSSRLQVESYSHSPDQPNLTAIKFRLDEGVVRSITGAWGEAARDRFRLNTPVAAIGVKGTDFIVKSEADKTTASVYTGAIILSPLTAGCMATLGPCKSGRETLLSDQMKGQMIELGRQQTNPQLVPLVDLLAQNRRAMPVEATARADKSLTTDGVGPDIGSDKAVLNEARSAGVIGASNVTPPVIVPPPPPVVSQLVWGRWDVASVSGDVLSKMLEEATQNGRLATVANETYGLFRPGSNTTPLQTTEASANFRLAGGAAQFVSTVGRPTEAATVEGGTLNVDFSRSTFATKLNVSNPTIGANTIQATGLVSPNGIMFGQTGNAYIAGAITLDAKEAGYLFGKAFSSGNLTGITLWGR